tara:strand:+ start:75 stop:365 length:291 start_codon:yes stop_codon:yes gene_type:complete
MADLFTVAQAQSSSILEVKKIVVGDAFHSWKVQISGSDGQEYRTRIKTLDGDASLDDIKGAAMAHLTGSEQYYVSPTVVSSASSTEFNDNIGDKLG